MMAQSNKITDTLNQLLTCLLVWILVMAVIAFLYGIPIMKRFIDEIN